MEMWCAALHMFNFIKLIKRRNLYYLYMYDFQGSWDRFTYAAAAHVSAPGLFVICVLLLQQINLSVKEIPQAPGETWSSGRGGDPGRYITNSVFVWQLQNLYFRTLFIHCYLVFRVQSLGLGLG